MRKWLLVILLATSVWAEPGGKLLDEVLARPGFWMQSCSARVLPSPRTIDGKPRKIPTYVPPLALFGYERWSESKISADNFLRLRARRTEMIQEIARRLHTGANPRQEYWMILLDLNGIEALPALLGFEFQSGIFQTCSLCYGQQAAKGTEQCISAASFAPTTRSSLPSKSCGSSRPKPTSRWAGAPHCPPLPPT